MSKLARRFRLAFVCLALAAWSAGAEEAAAPADDGGVCPMPEAVEAPDFGSSCLKICGPCEAAGGICVHVPGGCACA